MKVHAILEDHKFLLTALDNSADGVLIADGNGLVVYVNEAYERTTGLSREIMVGRNLSDLQMSNLFNESATMQVLKTRKTVCLEHRYHTGKNAVTTATPIFRGDEIVGVFNNTRNITELVQLREELNQSYAATRQVRQEVSLYRAEQMNIAGIVAVSETMRKVLDLAETASGYDSTVCIYGETGTGKAVKAKFIHQNSPRSKQPFIHFNCPAIPP